MAHAKIRNDLFERELELEKLAMSLARNQVGNKLPLKEVLQADMITVEFAEIALKDPLFVAKTKRYAQDLITNGFSFKEKARVIAEDGLLIAHKLLHDNVVPANVRLKALENLVDWADLAPKDLIPITATAQVPAFSINIILNQNDSAPVTQTAEKTVVPRKTFKVAFQPTKDISYGKTYSESEEDGDAYDN